MSLDSYRDLHAREQLFRVIMGFILLVITLEKKLYT